MLFRERSLRVKNRMREIRSSGSVRGGAGNIPAYSAPRLNNPVASIEAFESCEAVGMKHAGEVP
jgi:hypothetical protein